MKSYKNLFARIVSFDNLLDASYKAARGKRERPNVVLFFRGLEDNLWELRQELSDRTYRPGGYSTFSIYRPKPRMISAAPFRDRAVHHALINVIGPLLERSFIPGASRCLPLISLPDSSAKSFVGRTGG